jgi:threonine dehydrogenase-like Zn-dependent dehydrogenase
MELKFNALEYTKDDLFQESEYVYSGNEANGWKVFRNGEKLLELGEGYKLLKTRLCGVCSTDLDRRFLPFPLPQITGHELIAEDESGHKFAVEINDTYVARGSKSQDIFCKLGIPTHSPSRMVLGIDRLPGGFGKYILAPKNAMVPIGNVPEMAAVLTEPFSAALQAVIASPPKEGERVAVLGPRRLGSLIVAALVGYRKETKKNFEITAIARRDSILELTRNLGADNGINISNQSMDPFLKSFDIVYDTTASPKGFELALNLSRREVHLKSTNGQEVCGINKMTELVVDELSILPFNSKNLNFHWENDNWKNEIIYLSPSLTGALNLEGRNVYSPKREDLSHFWNQTIFKTRLPRFDLAIVESLEEIDQMIRPFSDSEESMIRPRGAILVHPKNLTNPIVKFISEGGEIHSSRCGDFHHGLKILEDNPDLSQKLIQFMISHEFSASDLPEAFSTARDQSSIKVVVKH